MSAPSSLFLIVEDHPEIAENNASWLKRLNTNCRIVTAIHPNQAFEHLGVETPDLAIVDLLYGTMKGEQSAEPGLLFLSKIFEQHKTLNVLVYSSEYRLLAPLMPLIDTHKGGFAVANKLEQRSVFLERAKSALEGELRIPRDLRQQSINFTDMEYKVLLLLCQDHLTDQAIADELHISRRAAQKYIQRLKEKLTFDSIDESQTNSRIALCVEAMKRGFLH